MLSHKLPEGLSVVFRKSVMISLFLWLAMKRPSAHCIGVYALLLKATTLICNLYNKYAQ